MQINYQKRELLVFGLIIILVYATVLLHLYEGRTSQLDFIAIAAISIMIVLLVDLNKYKVDS